MQKTTDYASVKFEGNGKIKLLIIVGTRPEIIRLSEVIAADISIVFWRTPGRITITI